MKDLTQPDFQIPAEYRADMPQGELERVWHLADGADPLRAAPAPHPERMAAMQAMLESTSADRPPLRLVSLRRLRPWMAVAASIVVLALVGLGWWLQPISHTAPVGETLAVILPDGSEVQLNSNSTLRYARSFGEDIRDVSLEGEAFFEVERSDIPFVIETFNSQVKVLGTSFNVQAWQGSEPGTVVTVASGLVEVMPRRIPAAAIRLTAGQHTNVSDEVTAPLPPTEAQLDEATAWRTGDFVFFNQTHGVILDAIARRFAIDIEAPATIRARPRTFSKFDVTSAEEVLSSLCQSSNLRYRATANGFEIFE